MDARGFFLALRDGQWSGSFELSGLAAGRYFLTVNVVTGPIVSHPFAPTYYPGVGTREQAEVVEVGQSRALPRGPFVLERTLPKTTITVEIICQDGSSPRSGSVLAIPILRPRTQPRVLPHSPFRGQTPDEMYFGTGDAVPGDLTSRAAARRTRLEANRPAACATCPTVDGAA